MTLQQDYDAALNAFHQVWQKACEAKEAARQSFQRLAKEKHGFGQDDVIEYDGVQGVCFGWGYPYELCNKEEILSSFPCFYPYRKDGRLSTRIRYIYDIDRVKVIRRVEETRKEHRQ